VVDTSLLLLRESGKRQEQDEEYHQMEEYGF
jgi:hypothetical protein